MRRLLNTLFVTSEDIYLALDGDNVAAKREQVILTQRYRCLGREATFPAGERPHPQASK